MGISCTLQMLSSHLTLFFNLFYFFPHLGFIFILCKLMQRQANFLMQHILMNTTQFLSPLENKQSSVCVLSLNMPYSDNCIKYTATFIYCLLKYTFLFSQRSVLHSVLGVEILMFKNCTANLGWKCSLDRLFLVAWATILP